MGGRPGGEEAVKVSGHGDWREEIGAGQTQEMSGGMAAMIAATGVGIPMPWIRGRFAEGLDLIQSMGMHIRRHCRPEAQEGQGEPDGQDAVDQGRAEGHEKGDTHGQENERDCFIPPGRWQPGGPPRCVTTPDLVDVRRRIY